MAVPEDPVRVPSQRPRLSHLSRQSRLSANDKGDNEMISGAVHRCSGICLMAEENSGEP